MSDTITEDFDNLESMNQITVNTLKMIQKRLKVEIEMKNRNEIKLLAKLISEPDQQVSYYIKNVLFKIFSVCKAHYFFLLKIDYFT